MAPDRSSHRVPRAELSGRGGLLLTMLSGMVRNPAVGRQLGEATNGPAVHELREHVFEVDAGVDAPNLTVFRDGVGDREALATSHRACKEVDATADRECPNSTLGAPIIDLVTAVPEASSHEPPLVDLIGRCDPQRDLGSSRA